MTRLLNRAKALSPEAFSGILLLATAIAALVAANGPTAKLYDALLDVPFSVALGSFTLEKPILLWINDGLMAVFFLVIGLEVKREMVAGSLATPSQRALPFAAALGGMIVPAIVFTALNFGDPVTIDGWAVPVATDIAFALGILALLGNRIPGSLKMFLLALAIFDDLGAIVIIALFYSRDLSTGSLLAAAATVAVLITLNRLKIRDTIAYLLVGTALWLFVLKSGVHATLAGVVLAFAIPYDGKESPAGRLEKALHSWVAFLILPVFAFANAGVDLHGLRWSEPRPTGHPGCHPGSGGRQAAGHLRLLLGGHPTRLGPAPRRRRLGPHLRRRRPLRHRLHHEPLHRLPGFRAPAPARAAHRQPPRHLGGLHHRGHHGIRHPALRVRWGRIRDGRRTLRQTLR